MGCKKLNIGKLSAKYPLIQGGMGVGISLGNLAGHVAKEGGIGIISTAQIGFKEEDFYESPLEANLRAIKKEYLKARKISPDGIIGFNIMVALNHYKEQVETVAECGANLIISGAGLATDLPEYVKDKEIKIAPIVSSVKSASVILKLWDRRYNRTTDLIVIEGPKAGGHLGFTKDKLTEYEEKDFDDEIKDIILVVRKYEEKYNVKIPVIVAGGISSSDDVKHAMSLGADGVQVATKFVTTKECDADINYKMAYINSTKDDIVIVKSPVGMPGRAIKNRFMEQVMKGKKYPPKKCLGCLKKCNPAEIPYCITERLISAAKGDIDNALLFCGSNAYMETEITNVKKVITDLFNINQFRS